MLGFSQGAALVALMCALQQRDPDGEKYDVAFLIYDGEKCSASNGQQVMRGQNTILL